MDRNVAVFSVISLRKTERGQNIADKMIGTLEAGHVFAMTCLQCYISCSARRSRGVESVYFTEYVSIQMLQILKLISKKLAKENTNQHAFLLTTSQQIFQK